MKVALGRSALSNLPARECFVLGQKVTELGAAIAYADSFSRGLSEAPNLAIKAVAGGLKTAETASGHLKGRLTGRMRKEVEKFEREIGLYASEIRSKFIDWPTKLTPKDVIEIQGVAASLRQKSIKIWDALRRMCPEAGAPAAARKPKKAR